MILSRLNKNSLWVWGGFIVLLALQALYLKVAIVDHDIILGQDIARRMLEGGSYQNHFFENNPPLLFYFHAFSLLIARAVDFNPIMTWYGLIFVLTLSSFGLSRFLIFRAYPKNSTARAAYSVFLIMALALVPYINFSQKSHLLMLLLLPYLFLSLLRLQQGMLPSLKVQGLIGVLGALGVCIKPPFYFFAPLLIELYWVFYTKRLSSLYRADLLAGVTICFTYLFVILVYHSDYVHIVFPIALTAYAPLKTASWQAFFFSRASLFFYLLLILYCFIRSERQFASQALLFIVASLGFLLSFILQKKGWPYQEIPSLICSVLALCSIYLAFLEKYGEDKSTRRLIGLIFFIALFFLLYPPVVSRMKSRLQCLINPECTLLTMTAELKKISNNGHYFVFSETLLSSYVRYYANLESSSRFASLWMNPYHLKNGKREKSAFVEQIQAAILEDFTKEKPSIVLVSHNLEKNYLNVGETYFDFLKKDEKFSKLWKQYHYQKTFTTMPGFQFSLYVRDKKGGILKTL